MEGKLEKNTFLTKENIENKIKDLNVTEENAIKKLILGNILSLYEQQDNIEINLTEKSIEDITYNLLNNTFFWEQVSNEILETIAYNNIKVKNNLNIL